tara:strand:+ start:18 stop:449 length:432 start_codon:yes stop_codon:yes gene_type:complete
MKNKQILLIIGILFLSFSSCEKKKMSDNEKKISIAISEVKTLGDFRKVEYKFIGNPSIENLNSTIKLELIEGSVANIDNELFGKKCAKIIFNASESTKEYDKIWISFVDTKRKNNNVEIGIRIGIRIGYSKEVKNFIFNKSEL